MIVPIREVRDAGELSELCRAAGGPVFVTREGGEDLVVMRLSDYQRRLSMADLYEKLETAEEQIRTGQVRTAKASLEELREKHGL